MTYVYVAGVRLAFVTNEEPAQVVARIATAKPEGFISLPVGEQRVRVRASAVVALYPGPVAPF